MSAQAATTQAASGPGGHPAADLYPAGRLEQAAEAAGRAGLDALLLTPGPDLRYLTGYDTHQLERLTCLAVPAGAAPPSWWCPGWNWPRRRRPQQAA